MRSETGEFTPSELWTKLIERPRPSEIVELPCKYKDGRYLGRVRMRLLTKREEDSCRIRGLEKMHKVREKHPTLDLESGEGKDLVADAQVREALWLACQTVEDFQDYEKRPDGAPVYAQAFKSPEDIDDVMASTELEVLWLAYKVFRHKCGPHEDCIWDTKTVTTWIQRVVEGAKEHPFLHTSYPQLVELNAWLTSRVYILSALLDSLSESLPDSLRSHPEILACGIGSHGWLPVKSSGSRLRISLPGSGERKDDGMPILPDVENPDGQIVTMDQAVRINDILTQQDEID